MALPGPLIAWFDTRLNTDDPQAEFVVVAHRSSTNRGARRAGAALTRPPSHISSSHIERRQAVQLSLAILRSQPGVHHHDDESMRPGGGVLFEPRLHLGPHAAQLAPHDSDVHPLEVAAGGGALGAQFAQLLLELRRAQENRAPSVAP